MLSFYRRFKLLAANLHLSTITWTAYVLLLLKCILNNGLFHLISFLAPRLWKFLIAQLTIEFSYMLNVVLWRLHRLQWTLLNLAGLA